MLELKRTVDNEKVIEFSGSKANGARGFAQSNNTA